MTRNDIKVLAGISAFLLVLVSPDLLPQPVFDTILRALAILGVLVILAVLGIGVALAFHDRSDHAEDRR